MWRDLLQIGAGLTGYQNPGLGLFLLGLAALGGAASFIAGCFKFVRFLKEKAADQKTFIGRTIKYVGLKLIPLMLGAMGLAGLVLIVAAIIGAAAYSSSKNAKVQSGEIVATHLQLTPEPEKPKPPRYFSKTEKERIGTLIAEMRRALNGDGKQAVREIEMVGQIEPGMSRENLRSNIDRMKAAREKLNGVYQVVYRQIIGNSDNADIRDELEKLTGPANLLLDLNTAADYRSRAMTGILDAFDQLNHENRTLIMMGLGAGGNELRLQAQQVNNWLDSSVRNIDQLNQQLAQQ